MTADQSRRCFEEGLSQMAMRKHQEELVQIADRIIAGTWQKRTITLDCTPGGGKTGAATLFANRLLDAGVIDRVLWLVPRLALADQIVSSFASGVGASSDRQLDIVECQDNLFAENLPNTRLVVGHVTTYQQVAAKDSHRRFRDACQAKRTLLILDEVQFLSDLPISEEDPERPPDGPNGQGWTPKLRSVHDAAIYVLNMSGTLFRTDNSRVFGVDYERRADDLFYPCWDVQYSLRDAVSERAILPVEWANRGGEVSYIYDGKRHDLDLLDDADDETSGRMTATFLNSDDVVSSILEDMISDWRRWRDGHPKYYSRMLVMADGVARAKWCAEYIQNKHPDIACVTATTEVDYAKHKLKQFREGVRGQCLVTVAMAYIGFDCPNLTHLAYLTRIRAPSYMLQAFARVSRFDNDSPRVYESQHAFVYAPDDPKMRRFCDWLRQEQEFGVRQRKARQSSKEPSADPKMPDDFEPIRAEVGERAIESLQERIDPETAAMLERFRSHCGPYAASLPTINLLDILRKAKDFKEAGV